MQFNKKPRSVSKPYRFRIIQANYGHGVAVEHYKSFVNAGIRSAYKMEDNIVELLNSIMEWKYILFLCHMVDDEYKENKV